MCNKQHSINPAAAAAAIFLQKRAPPKHGTKCFSHDFTTQQQY